MPGVNLIIPLQETMYNKNDKRRLYWLIDQYISNQVDEDTFTSNFHDTLVNEIYDEGLTDIEIEVFHDLHDVSERFTEYEEDFKLWSGFVSAKQLREKVLEIKEKLREQKILYDKTIKQKLYSLIDRYLSNYINETTFCNEFHDTFVNDVYYEGLTDVEQVAFCSLDDVTQCYTDNEEYRKLWSGYITAKQLKEKVLETKEELKEYQYNF